MAQPKRSSRQDGNTDDLGFMFPSFTCAPCADSDWERQHKERKLRMLRFWRDGLERQIAAVSAAISTLEQQIERDQSSQG